MELQSLLIRLKAEISDDFRAYEEDSMPGMLVTIGTDGNGGWDYQTGDNSYSGSAYHYPHWAVVALYRRSNCIDVADDIRDQLASLINS